MASVSQHKTDLKTKSVVCVYVCVYGVCLCVCVRVRATVRALLGCRYAEAKAQGELVNSSRTAISEAADCVHDVCLSVR